MVCNKTGFDMENLRLSAKIGLKWVFIPFLIILVMSHNAGALTLTDSVDLIRGNMVYQFNCLDCSNFAYSAISDYGYTRIYNPNVDVQSQIRGLQLNLPSESYLSADYLTLDIFYTNDLANNSLDAYFKSITTTTSGWDLVDVSFDNLSTGGGVVHLTFKCYTPKSYTSIYIQSLGGSALYLWNNEYISSSVATHWRPKSGVNYSQAIQNVVNAINSKDYTQDLEDIKDAIEDQNQQEQEAVEDASDAAETAANDNSSNAATTNLIGVISNFISAITNFSGSDCNITLAFPSYAGGSMNVNVCQNKDKAGNIISVFTSLSLIVFYLPLAFKLLSMIYNEIRSFTNG